jgi:hypothetical protein
MEEVQERLREIFRRGRSPEPPPGLRELEGGSDTIFIRETDGRIRSIWDQKLGGVELSRAGDREEADHEVRRFLAEHAELFGVEPEPGRGLELNESRGETNLRLSYRQRHHDLRVVDSNFAAFFDETGGFNGLSGAPWPESLFPDDVSTRISESEAVSNAIHKVRSTLQGSYLTDALKGYPELVISGARGSVLWKVLIVHQTNMGAKRELLIDAQTGEVVEDVNLIATGVKKLSVLCLAHKGGKLDDSTTGNPSTELHDIHVNLEPFGNGTYCLVRLQRLGTGGGARMWNARLSGGTDSAPVFGAAMALAPCNDLSQIVYFQQEPQSGIVEDYSFRFNEQNTFVWAQKFKTQIDEWGRKGANKNGYHYPVDAGRDVNLEIVVNGAARQEVDWYLSDQNWKGEKPNTMHGFFRSRDDGVPSSWFPGVSNPCVVFFFNSQGNQNSPQFIGDEFTASYAIIAHEIGHFISWTYGDWFGASKNMRISLQEGISMAFPAIWGKSRWPKSLGYTDSGEVTTGSFVEGTQWKYHPPEYPRRYDLYDCEKQNPYKLAWPFVQAIWELANNVNKLNEQPIWDDDEAAVDNTADLVMNLLHTRAGVSGRTWTDLACGMLVHQYFRHKSGRELAPLSNMKSILRVIDVLDHHGLFDGCK